MVKGFDGPQNAVLYLPATLSAAHTEGNAGVSPVDFWKVT